ncbi:acetyl-coenzyme A synthetase N-terminal domain-containing protein, partial [Escherichia coli]|uniref:acetyl-coenzyme A synthetase N-terminal domain-containing protein n=1 Tax=Escherichia coli TaxID=562 RepID=UPI0018259AE7
ESHQKEVGRFPPPKEFSAKAHVQSHAEYTSMYDLSLSEPETFWREQTQDLCFRTPWKTFVEWKLPHAKFFVGSTLNITESCLD